jgi:uncharacterized protein
MAAVDEKGITRERQMHARRELLSAISQGDAGLFERWMGQIDDSMLTFSSPKNASPLAAAASKGRLDFLDAIALRVRDADGDEPWALAMLDAACCGENALGCLARLLELRPQAARLPAGAGGQSPLMAAVSSGRNEAAALLAPHSDLETRGAYGDRALEFAIFRDNAALTELLLPLSDWKGGQDQTPLHLAAYFMEALRVVAKDPRADGSACDEEGRTPLMLSASKGLARAVNLLLPLSNLGDLSARGESAFFIALHSGRSPLAAELLLHPGCESAQDAEGRTGLSWAAEFGSVSLSRRLLDMGADPLRPDADGSTPLMRAVAAKQSQTIDLLIRFGGLDAVDQDGLGALALSVKHNAQRTFERLLENGADPLAGPPRRRATAAAVAAAATGQPFFAERLADRLTPEQRKSALARSRPGSLPSVLAVHEAVALARLPKAKSPKKPKSAEVETASESRKPGRRL